MSADGVIPGRGNSSDLAGHRDCLTHDDLVGNVRIETTEGANRYLVSPGDSIERVAAFDSVVVCISWNFGGRLGRRPGLGNLILYDLFEDRDGFGNSSFLGGGAFSGRVNFWPIRRRVGSVIPLVFMRVSTDVW